MLKSCLCQMLAVLMLLSLTACSVPSDPETATSEGSASDVVTEENTVAFPDVPKQDYHGASFHMIKGKDDFPWYFLDDEKAAGGVLESAIVEMNHLVEEHLNVELSLESALIGSGKDELFDRVRPTITAGDDEYQLCILRTAYSTNAFLSQNYVMDFYDMEEIDLERDYWNKEVMDSVGLNDRAYIGLGDLCQYDLYAIYANKNRLKNIQRTVPYDKVRNGEWTLDAFMSETSGLYADNGDGKKNNKDVYGYASIWDVNANTFLQACDIRLLTKNEEGSFDLTLYGERLENMYAKLDAWSKDSSVWLWQWLDREKDGAVVDFLDNQSYYTCDKLGTQYLEAAFDVAVLPMPKYDKQQENYAHVNWGNNLMIPSTVRDKTMVGQVLEMMGYYSSTIVLDAYYHTVLQYRVSNSPDDREMVELIHNTVTFDPGIAYSDRGIGEGLWRLSYAPAQICWAEKAGSCAAFYRKYEKNAERAIRSITKWYQRSK